MKYKIVLYKDAYFDLIKKLKMLYHNINVSEKKY